MDAMTAVCWVALSAVRLAVSWVAGRDGKKVVMMVVMMVVDWVAS